MPTEKTSGGSHKSFLKHAAVYGFGTVLLQAASIVLLPLYTHCLTPADYGVLEILNQIGQALTIFLMMNGIRLAALAFYSQAKDEAERERTASTISLLLLIVGLSGMLLLWPFADRVSSSLGIGSPLLLMCGVIAVMAETTTVVPLALMQARVDSVRFVVATLTMFLVRIGLTILAVAVMGWGIWGILGARVLSLGTFGVLFTLDEMRRGSFRPDMGRIGAIVKFAAPFIPAGICGFALHAGDRFFLSRCAGNEQLGFYALAYKLGGAAGLLAIDPLHRVWSARMYPTFEQPDAAKTYGTVYTWLLASYIFPGMAVCIFANEVLTVLAAPAYMAAASLIAPIILAYFMWSASCLFDSPFYVCRRTSLKPAIMFASAVVILGLYAWLIPQFGAIGAAYATLGGFTFHATLTLFVAQRVFRVQLEPGRLGGMLGLAILGVLLASLLGNGLLPLFGKAAILLAWPTLLWVTGLIRNDEKSAALGMVRPIILRFWIRSRRELRDDASRQ